MLTPRSLPLCLLLLVALPCPAQELESADPTVVGQVEHFGYGLVGPRGRHYVFGGLAMADYADSAGQRRIVTLQREDHIQDEKFVYFRELRTGHRWAVSRRAAGGTFGVWFQLAPADNTTKPRWLSFHRARLEVPGHE
jgi:hypothetical protein